MRLATSIPFTPVSILGTSCTLGSPFFSPRTFNLPAALLKEARR